MIIFNLQFNNKNMWKKKKNGTTICNVYGKLCTSTVITILKLHLQCLINKLKLLIPNSVQLPTESPPLP